MARTQNIPCDKVAETTVNLQLLGYKVLGSAQTPGQPGFCTLQLQYPASAAARPVSAPALMLAAAPAPAATTTATAKSAIDPLQEQAAKAIVNIFETGAVLGKYGQVTVIKGDPGHLTFGRSQTTLASGNLGQLISNYCNAAGARFGARLKPYLPKLNDRLTSLDNDLQLHNLLRATADDPVMRAVQDKFFDDHYWQVALSLAAKTQIVSALGIAVVYDSTVQGSWDRIHDRTVERHGTIGAPLSEQEWIKAYIETREAWLATNAQSVLHSTVYRMDAFQALIAQDKWSLELPLLVRGEEISLATLMATPPGSYDGPALGSRALAVTTPLTRGADVRLVQLGLSDAGIGVKADGVYGSGTAAAVKQYQAAKGLASADVADQALVLKIGSPA